MSGISNVGTRHLHEAGDQRNYKQSEIDEKERYWEGKQSSHNAHIAKDQRSAGNTAMAEDYRQSSGTEADSSKQDPTLPARSHGNEPSKGAKIDAELKADDEEYLKKKGRT